MKKLLPIIIAAVLLVQPVSAKKLDDGVYIYKLGKIPILKQIRKTIKQRQNRTRWAVKPAEYTYQDPRSHLAYVVEQQGLSSNDYKVLDSIMYCESKYDPNAVNPYSGASGLFQFLGSSWAAWGEGSVFDPARNIEAAVRYYKVAGVSPWVQCVY